MLKTDVLIAIGICCLLAGSSARAQVRPRPAPERRGPVPERAARPDKWAGGQKKGTYNRASGADKSKKAQPGREDRRAATPARKVEKANKWRPNQIREKFNTAANPPPNPPGGGGGKNGGGNAAPPSGPSGPKPRPPKP